MHTCIATCTLVAVNKNDWTQGLCVTFCFTAGVLRRLSKFMAYLCVRCPRSFRPNRAERVCRSAGRETCKSHVSRPASPWRPGVEAWSAGGLHWWLLHSQSPPDHPQSRSLRRPRQVQHHCHQDEDFILFPQGHAQGEFLKKSHFWKFLDFGFWDLCFV
jgi:hypothetical protein